MAKEYSGIGENRNIDARAEFEPMIARSTSILFLHVEHFAPPGYHVNAFYQQGRASRKVPNDMEGQYNA